MESTYCTTLQAVLLKELWLGLFILECKFFFVLRWNIEVVCVMT